MRFVQLAVGVLKFGSRTWNGVTSIPEERDNPGACTLGSNIYIFGGNDDYETETSTTYRFNTQMGEWTTLAPMPRAKAGHSVCVLDSLI
jgi:N-acetylneuraminic acid mutarotase